MGEQQDDRLLKAWIRHIRVGNEEHAFLQNNLAGQGVLTQYR